MTEHPKGRRATTDPVEDGELEEDALEPFREVPVGTNDPNIVGDVGPFDIPPGSDPHEPDDLPE